MSKNIFKIYMFVVVLCLGLLGFIYSNFTTIEFVKNQDTMPIIVKNLEKYQLDNNRMVLGGTIPDDIKQEHNFGFYTAHKSVNFYVDNELYYSFDKGDNLFGNTPGLAWHFVSIGKEDNGKKYYIEFISKYKSVADEVPKILLGERYDIFLSIFRSNIIQSIICLLIAIIGMSLIAFWSVMKRKGKISKGLLYLGIFSIILSIWSFNELPIAGLIFNNNIVTSNISYIMLMLMVVPFILFTKEFFVNSKVYFWDIICYLSLINTVVCIYLQVFKNIDFKLTLWTTHFILVLFVIYQIYAITKELLKEVMTTKMKVNVFGSFIILIGLIMDMYFYYFKNNYDANMIGRVCYLIYIILFGLVLLKEAAELMEKAREAHIYESLAFTDTLTGMKNRTKFINDINLHTDNEEIENMKIFMLDLNNLKKYNDNRGHDIGDYYIIEAANIIADVFSPYGNCYRIGGDEFCVIITESLDDGIEKLINKLREAELKHNTSNNIVEIQIACGFAVYNKDIDNNINDILRRADFAMYDNKKNIKK